MTVLGGYPRLQGLLLAQNAVSQAGGAVYIMPGVATPPLVIDGCAFYGNNATHLGGALCIEQVRHSYRLTKRFGSHFA